MHGEDILRAHASIGALQIEEGADQQSRAREEDERERNLGNDQAVANDRPTGAVSERGGSSARRSERRRQSKANSGRHADREKKHKDTPVQSDLSGAGELPGSGPHQSAAAPDAESEARHPPGAGQQKTFREELADDADGSARRVRHEWRSPGHARRFGQEAGWQR